LEISASTINPRMADISYIGIGTQKDTLVDL